MPRRLLAFPLLAGALFAQANFDGSMVYDLVHGPVRYSQPAKRNPVEALKTRIANGFNLAYDPQFGYLPAVLEALNIPLSSQTLVFSKTSFQAPLIMPSNPRAIYFNDDVYVGWVRGGDFVEISVADPDLGGVFYVIEQEPARRPVVQRQDDCLQCHHASRTAGVPGHIIRSVTTANSGMVITNEFSTVTDHRSPFSERWGGWYVSGNHGNVHRGNPLVHRLARFNPDQWPAGHSDVVALTVLAHQATGHNYLARLNYETRAALHMHRTLLEMDKLRSGPWSESTRRRIDNAIEATVRYLTFQDEAPLPAPIAGPTNFTREFSKRGPLREFDLQTRLFRYPLSFLVYSEALNALEPEIRDRFFARLQAVLHTPGLRAKNGPEAWRIFAFKR
jgi:hypothetical protein